MTHGDITHIDIPVRDRAAASAFYGALFGWNIGERPDMTGYPLWRAPGGVGGGLAPRGDGFTQPRAHVEIDSIDDTLAHATSLGGTVLMGKFEITPTSWWAIFLDPDGNDIGLIERSG